MPESSLLPSHKAPSQNEAAGPSTLMGLDSLGIAALLYCVDSGGPLLVDANDTARRQFELGERFPMADPWQWLDAQLHPAAGESHPSLVGLDDPESRGWRFFHIRQHQRPTRAVQLKASRLEPSPGEENAEYVLIAISEVIEIDSPSTLLPQAQPHLRQLLGSLPLGVCVIDVDGYLRLVNPAFCEFFGYPESQLLNAHFRKLLPPESRSAAETRHIDSFPHAASRRRAVEVLRCDGSRRSVMVEDTISRDDDGRPLRIAFLVDITERMEFERKLEEKNRRLEYLATRDELTGLHNRRFGLELLNQAVQRGRRYGEQVAVAMLDLDHFKAINDQHGHAVGDAVLAECSQFIKRALRSSDTLIRWGGEEFLLILPGIDRFSAQATVNRILARLKQRSLSRASLNVSFSAGVSEHHDQTPEALLEETDRALYRAKHAGRGCVAIADVPMPPEGYAAKRSFSAF